VSTNADNHKAEERADGLTKLVVSGVKSNLVLNALARIVLSVVALTMMGATLVYVLSNAREIADFVGKPPDGAESLATRVLAETLPVALLLVLAMMSGFATWILHSRGIEELDHSLDGIGRLSRQAEVAIPARGLTYVFEEKLANVRKAYLLQLWLGRTLFIVSLGLVLGAVLNAVFKGEELVSLALGGGGLLGAAWGTAKKVPKTIAHHLADVVQLQSAIAGCDRQIGLFETYAYALLKDVQPADRENVLPRLMEVHRAIEGVVDQAILRIEKYSDPEGLRAARDDNGAVDAEAGRRAAAAASEQARPGSRAAAAAASEKTKPGA